MSMARRKGILGLSLIVLLAISLSAPSSFAKESVEQRLDRLEKDLEAKEKRIQELEAQLAEKKTGKTGKKGKKDAVVAPAPLDNEVPEGPATGPKKETEATTVAQEKTEPPTTYEPGKGFRLFKAKWGEMNVAIYSYARYLNQKATDDTYTFDSGRTVDIESRQDLQLSKLQIKFAGWLGTPKFRYYLWSWTSNANMGQGAQVVLAGTLSYLFDPHFNIGAGIAALPTTRSTRGNFPLWHRVDARPIADEFFRGSYTTGIWAYGDIAAGFHYKSMIGNNLSQLGIDAGQLDNGFATVSTVLWWTSDNYATYAGYGDFEYHEKPALSFGGAYSRSRESKQSQPGKEDPENTQLRVSDGTGIFDIGAFAPGTQVEKATYQMTAFDGSLKYRGFAFDYNYYLRWIGDLDSQQVLPVSSFFDHGFDLQASYMILPRFLQVYAFGSKIFGQFGSPYETGGGFNIHPIKNRAMRFNVEVDYVHHSPVGYLAYPTQVGSTGPIFMGNFELNL